MQEWLPTRISGHIASRGRALLKPDWIQQLGEDFDALRHPQLAIANPAIYTFPFFLTWQRRHQWGVLPYAVHTRLGVICHPEHPARITLTQIQKEYTEELDHARSDQAAFWVNDPKYARWLAILLEVAGSGPVNIDRTANAAPLAEQHTSPTLFSVGSYLHKEILPLLCAVVPTPRTGGIYAQYARELEVSELGGGFLPSDPSAWPKNSAVIADLAVLPASLEQSGWLVLRLPHCVYVPVGIGYSVAAVPMLLEDRAWRNDLLQDAGQALIPAAGALANLGIELDDRFWNADRTDRG